MKKISTLLIIILLILPIFSVFSLQARASYSNFALTTEILQTIVIEDITILENGCSTVTLFINIPPSILADIYQKSDDPSKIEELYRSLKKEQQSFGVFLNTLDSYVVTANGEGWGAWISATASLQVVNLTQTDSGNVWEIAFGPLDEHAAAAGAGFLFTKIAFLKIMLESLHGEQVYESLWRTKIRIPRDATLLNGQELQQLDYGIEFGGGTHTTTSIFLDASSTITIDERLIVTEQEVTATTEYLYGVFSDYKSFKIEYLLSDSELAYNTICNIDEEDWSYDWKMPLWPTKAFSLTFKEDPLDVSVTITPSLTLSGHIGWEIGDFFEAWMSIKPSIEAEFVASATAEFSYQWEKELFPPWKHTFWFWVGIVPIWADLQFSANVAIEFSAYGKLTVTAQAEAGGEFKAGVKWTKTAGWSTISEVTLSAERTGPTITAEAGASVTPSIEFQIAFLIYGIAGPYVGFEPSATAMLTLSPPSSTWELAVNFKITSGATFAGWLKDLLDLDDYSATIYEQQIAEWSGTWEEALAYDFFITIIPEKILYKRADSTQTTVKVTNTRNTKTTFWLGVSFKDSTGESDKYNSQILVTPSSATLEPGETTTFSVQWTIPDDAPTRFYQIAVNCWKDSTFKESYTDNVLWEIIFFVYKLNILTPTTSSPTIAGDPATPSRIIVSVEWVPSFFILTPTFSVKIGDESAAYELRDRWMTLAGIYTLDVASPIQPSEGLYNLSVIATFFALVDSDNEPNAVEYVLAPPAEPIEKGLAWLRTQQYGDGSWRSSVGVTSLTVLAFLNAGYDETDTTVSKAINYLLNNVRPDGSIYNSYPAYETSLAILPLVATRNDAYKTTIENAKNWLVNSQWDESCMWGSVSKDHWYYGGFGYGWGYRPDLSNSQFALLALDAAGLPKDHPLWTKAQVFLHRCQNINFPITLNIEGLEYTVQPYNLYGGYDGGFIYYPGASLAGGQNSYGSMTGAGIWGLLLSGVPKTDARVVAAMNWVRNHYSWDTNPGIGWWRMYYYYLSMSKALTMYGEPLIDGHDWYQELYDKIVGMQIDAGSGQGYWSTYNEDYVPDLTTAYAILSLQTRAVAPPVHRLSYLTFILRSNCLIRIMDPKGNLVGYNYMTGLGENNVPGAVYSGPFFEPQYIVIVNPQAGTYRLELIGVSEGPYELTIQGNYGEEVTDIFEYTGEIKPAELHGCDVTVTAIVGPIDIYANPPEFEEVIGYNLTVTDNIGGLSDVSAQSGLKDECTLVTLTAPEYVPSEEGENGVRYKFSYWDVDGTPQGMGVNPIEVHMDAPHVATAHYIVQYYLTVKTDPAGVATIPGEGWYDPCTWVNLTAPLESNVTVKYHFAEWTVNSVQYLDNSIKVHMDEPKTATAFYKDYLGDAKEEINGLRAYVTELYDEKKIGRNEYNHFMRDLDKVEKDIDKAVKNLDKERAGYDDKMRGFDDSRREVMKLRHMIKDVENWARRGKIPAANATWIITELEAIRMKLVDKAWAEALAERALALKAIEDAKAKGKDTAKAEEEIAKVDRELAKAEQKIAEGKLSQAIQHFKHAFAHSHHAIKKAYDPTWTIDYKDWIDELEEMDP